MPGEGDIAAILQFFAEGMDGPVLVHCHSGVGRSAASAFAGLSQSLGAGRKHDALQADLRTPMNDAVLRTRLIVQLADQHMGGGGEDARRGRSAPSGVETGGPGAGHRRARVDEGAAGRIPTNGRDT